MAGTKTNTVTFKHAEVKQLGVKKTASLDKEYRIVIDTIDQGVMLADVFDAETTFEVTIEAEG